MSAPVIIAEAVIVTVVTVEIHIAEPVPVGRPFPVSLQIPKCNEIPANVVEHTVQNHPDAPVMALAHKALEGVIGAQPAVQPVIVGGFVAVTHGFKQRSDVQSITPQTPDVIKPGNQHIQPVHRLGVRILRRCAGQSQRINVVKNRFVIPSHRTQSPLALFSVTYS